MRVEIKGAKPAERQIKVHMKYDGKNKDVVNPNGKHLWCLWMQSMFMLKRDTEHTTTRGTRNAGSRGRGLHDTYKRSS